MLSPASQARLMGQSTVGLLLFLLALTAALWLARELAGVALGETGRPALVRSMAAMLVTLVLMTAMQRHARVPRSAAHSNFAASSAVQPQENR
jgi:hypothetical protein